MSTISRLFSVIASFDPRGGRATASAAHGHETRAHDALVLLATLAKADGVLGKTERSALASAADAHVGKGASALAFLDDPDHEGLDEVAARIRRTWSADERGELIGKAVTVAAADGEIGEIEHAMLDRLARLLDVELPQAAADDSGTGQWLPDA